MIVGSTKRHATMAAPQSLGWCEEWPAFRLVDGGKARQGSFRFKQTNSTDSLNVSPLSSIRFAGIHDASREEKPGRNHVDEPRWSSSGQSQPPVRLIT
jgi:hypothetical protein